MRKFPLNPFLDSLKNDDIHVCISDYERIILALQTGGTWTITRLRDVLLALLAKNADQQDIFLQRFDSFFPYDAEDTLEDTDIERVLKNLRKLVLKSNNISKPRYSEKTVTAPKTVKEPVSRLRLWIALTILIMFVGVGIWRFYPKPQTLHYPVITYEPAVLDFDIQKLEQGEVKPTRKFEQKRLYTDIPYVKDIQYLPLEKQKDWQKYAGIAVLLLIILIAYSLHLWHSRKIPKVKPAQWDKDGPRHFSMGSIGGKRSALLDDDILDQLADSMGYFQGEQASNVIDVTASVKATICEAGRIPVIKFNRRKQVRSLLVLEDNFAEASVWNTIAKELVTGMKQRGVPVLHGLFNGLPEEFKAEDGSTYRLEDLEDQRRGYLLLVFTDGKGIQGSEKTFALEALSRWPMAAWMELREKRFWDETSLLPATHCIPVYPASPDGIVKAVKRFLTEQGTGKDLSKKSFRVQHPVEMPARLDAYVEYLLGDALLWAQDCAMIQPVSQGMADALRRQFHDYLPAERVERLFALPGTFQTASGLRFSSEVFGVLRTGFQIRRNEHEQEAVLKFLLGKVLEAEPKTESDIKDSLQHLKWEAVKERICLELNPDYDGERLVELAQTPIGLSISEGFENFGFREEVDKIPLRIKPNAPKTLQRLAELDGNPLNIPKLKAFPIRFGQWFVVGMLIVSLLGFSGWSVKSFIGESKSASNFNIVGLNSPLARLEIKNGDEWVFERSWWENLSRETTLLENREYQITLYNNGYKTVKVFRTEKNKLTRIIINEHDIECPCIKEHSEMGLIVEYCADIAYAPLITKTWKEKLEEKTPKDIEMTIGLEFSDDIQDNNSQLRLLRNSLLQTASVDVLYRIQSINNSKHALDKMAADLAPWIPKSQLIWWKADNFSKPVSEDAFPEFESILNIDDEIALWISEMRIVKQPINNKKIDEIIANATEYIGTPYMWGGSSKAGIDSSALMQNSFRTAGFDIPRNSRDQATFWRGEDVTIENLQKGDLIFFKTPNWNIGHVGLVVSVKDNEVKFIHSSLTNNGVKENYLKGKWMESFVKGLRLFETINPSKPSVHTQKDYLGRYPQSSQRILTVNDLKGLNKRSLAVMLNEIFARNGYEFNDISMKEYFEKQDWYQQLPKITDDYQIIYDNYLSDIEKNNIELINRILSNIPQKSVDKIIKNRYEMKFIYIAPGEFIMGSSVTEQGRDDNEKKLHVTLTKGFYLQTTEVTVGQWRTFVSDTNYKSNAETESGAFVWTKSGWETKEGYYWGNPGFKQADTHPVTCISWNDALAFINWLNQKEGEFYRLPTEVEWEYACRAGTNTPFFFGQCLSTDQANYNGNYPLSNCKKGKYRNRTLPVASLKSNSWGLYDMHGNVWEWCDGWRNSDNVITEFEKNTSLMLRGGSWGSGATYCRSASRAYLLIPNYNSPFSGFRLVKTIEP
ncbi:MAG: SUMF1/EgtB/PvdO family nonheme iron enzyme [Desulfobacterales bacterium]|nr:SUMF1/EgtB/PvdO family nonheme iron enzyme [Desulfobacterales bacterium]